MDFKDQLFIIKNRLFEKRNIILIIVLSIIFLILFTCLSIIQFSVENKFEISRSEIGRTYFISPEKEQVDTIKNIPHVELVASDKYYSNSGGEITEFDNGSQKGEIILKALLKEDDVKIRRGKNISKNYEMICSDTFYPHYYDDRIYSYLFVSSKEILNKEVTIVSKNEDLNKKEITLNIVGTYKNKFMEEANTCYVNMETYDEIASKYSGWSEAYDEKGNLIELEYNEFNSYILRVDNKKNINKVLSSLDDMGVEYQKTFELDEGFLSILYFIPLFIGIIIILLTLSILYSFISKKINNRIHNIGILKSIGYDEKTIKLLNINENIFVIIISSIISFIVYFIVLNHLKYTILAEVTYSNYILNIPYILIILSVIFFSFIIVKIIKSKIKRIFNLNIQALLEK